MRNTKANIGSLSSMASKVRQEKKNSASAKAKAPLARARDSKKPVQDSSSSSDSDSDSSSSAESANGSDGEDDIGAARAKFLAKQAAKQKKAVGMKVNGAKPVAATPAKPVQRGGTPTSAQKPADDSSSDSSSESESESETSDSTSKPVTSQIKSSASKAKSGSSSQSSGPSNGVKAANKKVVNGNASESEESEDSDSSSDDEDAPRTGAQVNGNGTAKGPITTTQDSSSEEESESGSESDDEGDGGKTAVARTNGTDAASESTSQMSRPQWLNNSDFMLRKASSSNPGKEVADFFSNANLEGKQVWYFTAPASLPITVLKDMEIDLSKATKGAPLLTHEGDNYGLDLESYATNTQIQLLIPSSGGDKYTSLNHNIDSTVHLRRMAKFGPGGEVQATATNNYVPVPKPIREQPEGLKVRYTPIGVPAPAPALPLITPTGLIPANSSLSQAKTTTRVESSSSSEGESESDSDVEMTTPLPSAAPSSQTKSAKSGMTNGDRKRKHPGDETKATKRLKAELSTQVSSAKKHSPLQTPSSSAISNPTPSKKPSTKAKDKKVKATKDKTPKAVAMTPTTAKRTPIPLPSYPGMKR